MSGLLRGLLNFFWSGFVVVVIVVAFLFSLARLLFPLVGEYREDVELWIEGAMGRAVSIGDLAADWHALGPSLRLSDVVLLEESSGAEIFRFAEVRVDINLISSLLKRQAEIRNITLVGLELAFTRRPDGSVQLAGMTTGGGHIDPQAGARLKDWLFSRPKMAVENAVISWRDMQVSAEPVIFSHISFSLYNFGRRHKASGSAELPSFLGKSFDFAVDIEGDPFSRADWSGDIYLKGESVQLVEMKRFWTLQWMNLHRGRSDFEIWGRWRGRELVDLEGRFGVAGLSVSEAGGQTGSAPVALQEVSGGFRWMRRKDGWQLLVDRFSLARKGKRWPETAARLEYHSKSGVQRWQASATFIRVEDLLALAALWPQSAKPAMETIRRARPEGELNDIQGWVEVGGEQPVRYFLQARLARLDTRHTGNMPGVRNVAGTFYVNQRGGLVALDTRDAMLDFGDWFRNTLPVSRLKGRLLWRQDGQRVDILSSRLYFDTPHVRTESYLRVRLSPDTRPFLDLVVRMRDGDGRFLSHYLPVKRMNPAVVNWLDKAVLGGDIPVGGLVLRGPLDRFPFDHHEGRFEVRFEVRKVTLAYAERWPRLKDIQAEVIFEGPAMRVVARRARSFGSTVTAARVRIDDLRKKNKVLRISGTAQGFTADALAYLTETPLRDGIGKFFADAQAGGQATLKLRLDLPLKKGTRKSQIDGALVLRDSQLLLEGGAVDITDINGEIAFTQDAVEASDLRAVILGQPAVVDVRRRLDHRRQVAFTEIIGSGGVEMTSLARRFPEVAVLNHMTGTSQWHGSLRIYPPGEGTVSRATLRIDSDLQGVAVALPRPLKKEPDIAMRFVFEMHFSAEPENIIAFRYGDDLAASFSYVKSPGKLSIRRSTLHFGGGSARLRDGPGMVITGQMPYFDWDEWEARRRSPSGAEGDGSFFDDIVLVDVDVDQAFYLGQPLKQLHFQLERQPGRRLLTVVSDQAKGRIVLPDEPDGTVAMDFQYLHLSRSGNEEHEAGQEPSTDMDPREIPPLKVVAETFTYGEMKLGRMELRTQPRDDGLAVPEMLFKTRYTTINGNGLWRIAQGRQTSRFLFNVISADLGQTLIDLDFAESIRRGKANIDMDVHWSGSPWHFEPGIVSGKVSMHIRKGRLLQVDPGAGRIFGLLSLQTLPRRLTLDFSDLFAKGFSFDVIEGDFSLVDGNAYTENLKMSGPPAEVMVTGRVGLGRRDYDQNVLVLPNITASLPLAIGIVANPAAGAAAWLAEKIIRKPVGQIARIKYKITGSWDAPKIERITLPVDEQNDGSNPP